MRNAMLIAGLAILLILAGSYWIREGEVVVLHTLDAEGQHFETDLWIVEVRGHSYLRGAAEHGWVKRLSDHPEVELERAGRVRAMRAAPVADPAVVAAVDEAMSEKYGFADRVIGRIFNHADPLAVLLEPVEPEHAP